MPFTATLLQKTLVVHEGETLTFTPSQVGDDIALWLVSPYETFAGLTDYTQRLPTLPTLINYGSIIATNTDPAIGGVQLLHVDSRTQWPSVAIENHGLMYASSSEGSAVGPRTDVVSFLNTGTVTAFAPNGQANAIDARGVDRPFGPFFTPFFVHNGVGGEFEATGRAAIGVLITFANLFNDGAISAAGGDLGAWAVQTRGGYVENSGSIVADAPAGAVSIGIFLGPVDLYNGPRDSIVINTGTIEAAVAIDETFNSGVRTEIVNSGQITGDIILVDGDDVIRNSGSIAGNVQLGDGADLYDGRGGELLGVLNAGGGDDVLNMGSGGGVVDGGADNDLAIVELADATDGVAYLHSDVEATLLVGGIENLTLRNIERVEITTGAGVDNVTGGAGDDIIRLGRGDGQADGGAGTDLVGLDFSDRTEAVVYVHDLVEAAALVGGAISVIVRNAEVVSILGGTAADQLTGGAGDDVLEGGAGGDALDGGAGFDTASYASSSTGVNVVLGGAVTGGDASGDSLANIEALIGSSYADVLGGDAGNNRLDGGAGLDTMTGGVGDDVYIVDEIGDTVSELAAQGNDVVRASVSFALPDNVEVLELVGANALNATGNATDNSLYGNAGDNVLVGGAGADLLDGGFGFDTVSYATSSGAVIINMSSGEGFGADAAGDNLWYIEAVVGSAYNDTLLGTPVSDMFEGGGGADHLDGLDGYDTVSYAHSSGVSINLLTGIHTGGEAEGDTLANIEGVIGSSFDDVIVGNDSSNGIYAGAGNDLLSGGYGHDYLDGGDGFDIVSYATLVSGVTVDLGMGTATKSGVNFDTLVGIEGVIGSVYSDLFIGDNANNSFDGGAGADSMAGGLGDDLYIVDNSGDIITEILDGGLDTVQSTVTRNLTANIENLVLTGALAIIGYGNVLNNTITGNSAANSLYGFDGNDVLDGGAGADAMFGGNGDDVYYVDNAGDITSEVSALGGTDTVISSVNRNLTANIENLTLTGAANLTAAGNALNNVITGNSGANTLYGFDGNDRLDGGAGADTMFGGASGNDYFVVDDVNDITVEGVSGAAGGIDTVESSISRNLNANFENLTLTGTAQFGYGNILNNVMTGNAAANSLYGFDGNDTLDGGSAADQMFGGNGDDVYIVDNASDVTSEVSALGGVDTVISSVTRNLTANLENLTLSGSADITGAGNALDNVLTGNSGANTLYGLDGADTLNGGLGADTLQGGAGADTYVFSSALGSGNVDAIVGFNVVEDTIRLNTSVFTGLAAGTLDANAFHVGASAADADDRIIYDSATGALYWDADGNGAGAAVQFATLAAGLMLTSNDFFGVGP